MKLIRAISSAAPVVALALAGLALAASRGVSPARGVCPARARRAGVLRRLCLLAPGVCEDQGQAPQALAPPLSTTPERPPRAIPELKTQKG